MIRWVPSAERLATVSPLGWWDAASGLPGPAFWEHLLAAESTRCARYRRPATVVLAEIVGLAAGEPGERFVVETGAILRSGCRSSDYVMRLATTRMGMLLTETDEVAAINVVERLREAADKVVRTEVAGARVAFGWASPNATSSLLDAVERAEDLLRREASIG